MATTSDKAREVRRKARSASISTDANKTVNRNAKTAGIRLTMAEERAARKVLIPRIKLDRERTASRAAGIEKRVAKKTAAKRAAAAVGNLPAAKKSK